MAESLERLVRGLGAAPAGVATSVFSDWEAIVGEQIAAHCQPTSLRDRTLVVTVSEPGWATQLRFLETELLARIATATGSDEVASIQVRVRPTGGGPTR